MVPCAEERRSFFWPPFRSNLSIRVEKRSVRVDKDLLASNGELLNTLVRLWDYVAPLCWVRIRQPNTNDPEIRRSKVGVGE